MAANSTTEGMTNGAHDALATTAEEFLGGSYDYIICGGGTAGLVLAARLTENPNVTVGVLEAGPCKLDDVFVDTPAMFLQMFGKKEYEWMFKTTPQVS
jgi:choline dehydrogenase